MLNVLIANIANAIDSGELKGHIPSEIYNCYSKLESNVRINWLHIHDSSTAAYGHKDENTHVMSAVSRILDNLFNKDENGDYDGSRVTFSLLDVVDKENPCLVAGFSGCGCSGSENSFSELTFGDLKCPEYEKAIDEDVSSIILSAIDDGEDTMCQAWSDAFNNITYIPYESRISIFDGAIDFSDSYYDPDPVVDNVRDIRVITTLTSNCSRISPRDRLTIHSDFDRGISDGLWYNVMPDLKEEWAEDPGIDFATGRLLVDSCDDRDYPTLPELAKNLSRSSTGLSVIGYGNIYSDCDDTTGEFIESFYEFYGNTVKFEMELKGVPYHFTASDMTEADLTMTLLEAILAASGSCDGVDAAGNDEPCLTTKAPVTSTDAASTSTVSGESGASATVTAGTDGSVTFTGSATTGSEAVSSGSDASGSGDSATGTVTNGTEVEAGSSSGSVTTNSNITTGGYLSQTH